MGIFSDLANVKVGDVEPPKLIPIGHYQATIVGRFTEHTAKSGNTAARFPIQLIAPGDDVDAADLEAAGGLPQKKFNLDFWMSEDARFRFAEFAKGQGVGDDTGLMDALEEVGTNGVPFLIEAKHEPDSRDASKVYLRLDNPAPLA